MALGRSTDGLPFGAPDGEPVHLFIGMISPPYEDRTYLKVYRELGKLLLDPECRRSLLDASDPDEVLRALSLF